MGGRGGGRSAGHHRGHHHHHHGGGGDGGYHNPSAAADKDAQFMPFLNPYPCALIPVPLEFESAGHFAWIVANNLLAEFWHLIRRVLYSGSHTTALAW
jgi:hypothetical protein